MANKIFTAAFFAVCVFIINITAEAQDSYISEVNAGLFAEKTDNAEVGLFMLGGYIYFSPIDMEEGPYAEAAFYQQASYFKITGLYGKAEIGDGKEDVKDINPEIKLFMPFAPLFLQFSYERMVWKGDVTITSYSFLLNNESISDKFKGGIGYYLTDGMALAFTSEFEKKKSSYTNSAFSIDITNKTKIFTPGGNIKYVAIFDNDMAINIKAEYNWSSIDTEGTDKKESSIYSIAADLYFTQSIGVGSSFEMNKGDDKDKAGNKYSLRSVLFFGPYFGLIAQYDFFKPEEESLSDQHSVFFLLGYRI